MQINCKEHSSCGFAYTHSVISGKYKMVLLYVIGIHKVLRYNEIKRMIEGISHKALTNSLRELETDGLISRIEYPQIPPKVEYSLTAKGDDIMPMLENLCKWGSKYKDL